jgi:putative ABC transport system substrate-binding protein
MKRRDFIAGVTLAPIAFPLRARGETTKIYRIGILETISAAQNAANFGALKKGLRDRGFVEERNLRFEYRSADGRGERFPDLAADLVRLGVDLIATRGTPAAKAAKNATSTIPIVMCAIGEPLGTGVVETLAHPGGNVTGLSAFVTELSGKRIELLKEMFPAIARVGFLQNMGNPVALPQWEQTKAVAAALGLSTELLDVRNENDLKHAFAQSLDHKIDAISVGIDALTQARVGLIVELAGSYKLPTAYPAREFVEAGGIVSYGPNYPDLYYRSAALMDKIFKGAKPGDLPVEQPTKIELVINHKSIKILGLAVPPAILSRADEVIE